MPFQPWFNSSSSSFKILPNSFLPEFDRFLEERAKVADQLPTLPNAPTGAPSMSTKSGPQQKKEKAEDAMFALWAILRIGVPWLQEGLSALHCTSWGREGYPKETRSEKRICPFPSSCLLSRLLWVRLIIAAIGDTKAKQTVGRGCRAVKCICQMNWDFSWEI